MAFTPRLTEDGIRGNPLYYANNPFYQSGYGMPNCTCYAYGRAAEIAGGVFVPLPLGDATTWYAATSLPKGPNPALGATGVWETSDPQYGGHVATVEYISPTGEITFSCSGFHSTYFWTEVCTAAEGFLMNYMKNGGRPYTFRGYIYNPYAGTGQIVLPQNWIKGNRVLTEQEMQNNALIIWSVLYMKGWSRNAVAGMLGNMQSESGINPGYWEDGVEYGRGFGLVQWTPYTNYTNWASSHGYDMDDGYGQLEWIDTETVPQGQWNPVSPYNLTFDEFKKSDQSPAWLASAFLRNFERPWEPLIPITEPVRRADAERWAAFLDGKDPLQITPPMVDWKPHKMPVWMMNEYF